MSYNVPGPSLAALACRVVARAPDARTQACCSARARRAMWCVACLVVSGTKTASVSRLLLARRRATAARPPACAAPFTRSAPRLQRRAGAVRGVRCAASGSVDVHRALEALLHEDAFMLDVRTAREYDREHITKPPKRCLSVPYAEGADAAAFGAAAAKALGRPLTKQVLVMTASGDAAAEAAAAAVSGAGYTSVFAVAGGWGASLTSFRSVHASCALRARLTRVVCAHSGVAQTLYRHL